jgi:hypothetical protein
MQLSRAQGSQPKILYSRIFRQKKILSSPRLGLDGRQEARQDFFFAGPGGRGLDRILFSPGRAARRLDRIFFARLAARRLDRILFSRGPVARRLDRILFSPGQAARRLDRISFRGQAPGPRPGSPLSAGGEANVCSAPRFLGSRGEKMVLNLLRQQLFSPRDPKKRGAEHTLDAIWPPSARPGLAGRPSRLDRIFFSRGRPPGG